MRPPRQEVPRAQPILPALKCRPGALAEPRAFLQRQREHEVVLGPRTLRQGGRSSECYLLSCFPVAPPAAQGLAGRDDPPNPGPGTSPASCCQPLRLQLRGHFL